MEIRTECEEDSKPDTKKEEKPAAESLTNPFATATSTTLPRPSFMQEW